MKVNCITTSVKNITNEQRFERMTYLLPFIFLPKFVFMFCAVSNVVFDFFVFLFSFDLLDLLIKKSFGII